MGLGIRAAIISALAALAVATAPYPAGTAMAQEAGSVAPPKRPATLAAPQGEGAADPAAADAATPETPTLAAPQVAPAAAAKPKVAPRDPSRGSVTNLPLPRFVSLKGNEGNARRGPGLTHRIDWVFTRAGMPLKITAEYEHWRRVEDAEGAGGWVHYSLLSGVRSALVAADMADFRDKPRDDAAVAFQAERNVIGWIQECDPDWCRISVDGDRGWVRKSALWGVTASEMVE